jgi:hypothetical protein
MPLENRVIPAHLLILPVDSALNQSPGLIHDLPVKIKRDPMIGEEIYFDLIIIVQVRCKKG